MNFLRGSSSKSDSAQLSNEEILKAKGLLAYFQDIGPDLINKRVCMGWLRKRSKGKTKYFQSRWFILVSARELTKNCKLDEEIITEAKLPPWMELETIYYFDDKEILTESKTLNSIPMKDCLGVIVKDMSKSKDKGFTFKIDMGDRIFHLNADKLSEKDQWTEAVECSMETVKRQKKSRLGALKKNSSLIEKLYSEGGTKLQDKIIDDFLKIEAKYPVKDLDNLDEYLKQSMKMSEDLINVIDACMAIDPPKTEIVFAYFPIYHEKTCQLPTIYYENSRKTLANLDIIKLLNWLHSYSSSLGLYGIRDQRLLESIKVLSNLLTKKMLKAGAKMVFNILLQVRDSNTLMTVENLKQTSGPLDLFKILNETFDNYKRCQHKEVAEKMLMIMRKKIFYYQSYLEVIYKEFRFKVEKYIGLSNDTLAYVKNTNDFASNAQQMTGLEEAEVDDIFSKEEINKRFLRIGDLAFEKLVDAAFHNLADYFKVNFMELDMDNVLASIITHLSEIYKSLHPSYLRKVWKLCLDKVIILYLQCLLNSANKLKIKDINMLIDKMYNEKDLCKPAFKARGVSAAAIEASANVLQELIGFFEAGPAFVPLRILDLRKSHGPSFNINAVKALMNLRVDFTSSERSSSLKECKEILMKYKEETGGVEKAASGVNLFQRIEVQNQGGDDDEEEEKYKEEDSFEEMKTEDSSPRRKVEESDQKDSNKLGLKTLEGFLDKKSAGITKAWEKRYFALKNGKLYWYNHERARAALNNLELKDVKKCEPSKDKEFKLESEGKVYTLKAGTTEERNKWVQVINELVEELNDPEPKFKNEHDYIKIITGGSFFYDYESEWKTRPEELLVIKGQRDPMILEDIRVIRSKTYAPSPKKNAKDEKERRKSIVFDDIGVELPS